MRVISLNTWAGKVLEPLLTFVRTEAPRTDVFCFQEIFNSTEMQVIDGRSVHLFTMLCEALPDFVGLFAPVVDGIGPGGGAFPTSYGIAMFVRKDLRIHTHGDIFVYRNRNWHSDMDLADHGRNLQYALIERDGKQYWILNIHGLWTPTKDDTPERIAQSEKILEFVRDREPLVLCGDFNLAPDTQSIALLGTQMRNLIREYGITTTRNALYTKPVRFADYVFVKHIDVKDFTVPQIVVSDHLPMILEF